MKKFIYIISTLLLTITFTSKITAAKILPQNQEIEYFDDGSYLLTKTYPIINSNNHAISTMSTLKTITHEKTSSFYNNKNELKWYVKVKGTFKYNNSNFVTCTNSEILAKSFDRHWKITNKSTSIHYNTAIASAIGEQYNGTILIKRISKKLSISCNYNGYAY